jgi:DNA mismatch repair protein MutL
MALTNINTQDIQVLPPQEARRIAAGEVIDRPAALIREFIDNAIDAGASVIEVSIEGGGAKKAEVSDNGCGMDRENLEKCVLPHATSKIRSLADLDTAETLGFRGEALAAAAAVAVLEIITAAEGGTATAGGGAWRLEAGPGGDRLHITAAGRTRGSTVRALNLFESIPARKKFLKRDGSEAALCRQMFIDKALAFPEITFRFTQDGKPKDFFPAAASKKERFGAAMGAAALTDAREGEFLHEIGVSGEGFSVDIVIGGPELFRADRRMLYVFANGRRIQDYSLINAMEYGTQGWFPNGTHPVGAVYLDIDPALADFNIHPAKREARFKDPGAIHHAISAGLRDFCRRHGLKSEIKENANPDINYDTFLTGNGNTNCNTDWLTQANGHEGAGAMLAMKALLDSPPIFAPLPGQARNAAPGYAGEDAPIYGEPRYAGCVFGVFILLEWGDKLFIIDQHAAHERILYDRFLSQPIPAQELLVPITFNTESGEDDNFLEAQMAELANLGIVIEKDGNTWQITALPADWRLMDAQTVKELLALREAGENIAERWAATLSCHQAIRDGERLDDASALALAKEALKLPEPRCPHGRPIWTEVSREALYKAVRRT